MKKEHIIISAVMALCGILFFIIEYEWIVFRGPFYQAINTTHAAYTQAHKKKATLHFWHHDQWHTEQEEIIWTDNKQQNTQYLLNAWLTLLEQERVMYKKVALESAVLSPSGYELYCSFSRSPLSKQAAIYDKWMWTESLLKTIRTNELPVQSVRILVRHHPLQDPHLDFSNAWPIAGFITD